MNPLVVANWKMNLDLTEAYVLCGRVASGMDNIDSVDVVLCPPSAFLFSVNEYLKAKSTNLQFGCQNTMYEDEGAYTGELSLKMLKPVVKYAIVGHSERRAIFKEDDALINKKVKYVLNNNVTAVLCVGEGDRYQLEEYYEHEVKKMAEQGGILYQIENALRGVDKRSLDKLVIAYEPVWAIGTGNAATGAYAAAICYIIRNFLVEKFGDETARAVRILYGGSVASKDTREFMLQPSIDGLLVGGASLKAKDFLEIVRISAEVKSGRKF
jgi:triosephosphate isomerase